VVGLLTDMLSTNNAFSLRLLHRCDIEHIEVALRVWSRVTYAACAAASDCNGHAHFLS
jgi:hypothetical protein